jgi:hypothetical protein
MRLAFLSHTAMGGPFVVGSHQLAASLAASGHRVQHVSAPITPAHLIRLRDSFVRARAMRWARGGADIRGVADVVPLTLLPWALARAWAPLRSGYSRYMLAGPTRSASRLRLDDSDALIIDEPRMLGLARRKAQRPMIYRATDLYAVMRHDRSILHAEETLCREADAVVATSDEIAVHLRRLSARTVHVIGNGVEFAHFASAREPGGHRSFDLPGTRAQRAVYVGSFDARFSCEAIIAAALALPEKRFVLAGPGSERVAQRLGCANVLALGPVRYPALPQLLRECSVGLLPLSSDAANAGRSPMKLFEYAAAGLAIAATPALVAPSGRLASLCRARVDEDFPANVAEAFARATDGEAISQAAEIARGQDWSAKADALLSLIRPSSSWN